MALCWDAAAVGCGIDVVVFFVRARVFRDLFSLLGEKRFSEAVGALETCFLFTVQSFSDFFPYSRVEKKSWQVYRK